MRELSPRQQDILELMALGLCDKEIGARLGLSPKTIKVHNTQIFKRMNVRNRTEAAIAHVRRFA